MDWLYLLAGSRTVLIIKLLKIEIKKWRGTVYQRNNSRRFSAHERLRGSPHTQHVEWKQSHGTHQRNVSKHWWQKEGTAVRENAEATQDPLLVPQVKVKDEKDLHNSFLLIYLFFN